MIKFKLTSKKANPSAQVIIAHKVTDKVIKTLAKTHVDAILSGYKKGIRAFVFTTATQSTYVEFTEADNSYTAIEASRRKGATLLPSIQNGKMDEVTLIGGTVSEILALAEGIALSSYGFNKYKTKTKDLPHGLKTIYLQNDALKNRDVDLLQIVTDATFKARNLVNEPQNHKTAVQLAKAFQDLGKDAGFKVDVWNEAKIISQKMGGIISVNQASKNPPTFTIMEYKPKKAKNKNPIVLVGKGVVYDTGGLSLKPTPASMDHMKCDMAGSAVVGALMYAVAKAGLSLHIVGLVPATDNWIGENAYAPGDIITMYDGTSVEILNTDAEGRLILADALHFAKKLKPELVCDFATLTGAAIRAIGNYAAAVMGTAKQDVKDKLFDSSYAVFERLVEFPLWDDYAEELKSSVADMTNLGKGEGGQMSAAKFLQHFTDYPWLHFDIAGPAFNHSADHYKPKGGTGYGVRLMFEFLTRLSK